MQIVHNPGNKHGNADALSRLGVDTDNHYEHGVRLVDLPCGGVQSVSGQRRGGVSS
ncbi:hypothetical protein DPMN_048358 [Dreissena polymorpha]|uniref:Uncharacterized protein n=1 Tax=Dreissena polymorpha TaxID=45954 RepID=A0A9D4DD91_DREPO|nr:hypothetical protein DPMN_048358 [Dreissena polymorpha]